jgi:hypothetical protein
MKTWITSSGDEWDLIACLAYGQTLGADLRMAEVIEANVDHLFTKQFPANVRLNIPDVPRRTPIRPLIPWTAQEVATTVGGGSGGGTGPAGPPGTAGSKWYSGPTDPPAIIPGANIGDFYLQTLTGDVYEFTATGFRRLR